ncbi:MAG TPA: TetR/AcrR family transcriptional regulator [Spongiibacteraceae bacterium]|nr:TetR/AcrR family transcriptional regulator [Spongiibacteraceae bacterium]
MNSPREKTAANSTRKQKVGLESSATRARLLEAAEQLMLEEGYAAVTSRRLGAKAGVRSQLVHYYFPSMDELFVALFRHCFEKGSQAAVDALSSDQPLRVIWQQAIDLKGTALSLEFMALANHRKAIRAEFAKYGEQLRQIQHDALIKHLQSRGITANISPKIISLLLSSIGMLITLESQVGMSYAHDEALILVELVLREFEASGMIRIG